MNKIEQSKSYTGKDLETIFFRPMLSGPDARDLGIKILYNMPVPTTLHLWERSNDVLQKFSTGGWNGSDSSDKVSKSVAMHRVKAETGYSASDYFDMVYEQIAQVYSTRMGDLSETDLEKAETELFKTAIAESIRITMWLGNTARTGDTAQYNTFDGFLKKFKEGIANSERMFSEPYDGIATSDKVEMMLDALWSNSSTRLRNLKPQGQLVYLVTSDFYSAYEQVLDSVLLDSAFVAKQNGHERLAYKGIPVINLELDGYFDRCTDMPHSFGILTDRRNLALAVNTADYPGTEVKMWYNPDVMENRQRAIFMAGCEYLLPELISYIYIS